MTEKINKIKSPAKVNLWLKVTDKRNDGYHELESLFIPLQNPADELTVTITESESNNISIKSSDESLPLGPRNICWKAAEKYLNTAGITANINIELKKIVPVAAGLGGGSSNAAMVLTTLQSHFQAIPENKLSQIAIQIGADVPFFLRGLPAVAKGIGEKLDYIECDVKKIPILIVAPDFPVSAKWAYQHLNPDIIGTQMGLNEMLAALKASDWKELASHLHNDLAFALYKKFPFLDILKTFLLEAGALNAEISGSGPTMFAIFQNHELVVEAIEKLQKEFSGSVRLFY